MAENPSQREETDRERLALFDGAAVIVTTILAATLYIGLWFVLGFVRRISKQRS